jgi:hypothetical protein
MKKIPESHAWVSIPIFLLLLGIVNSCNLSHESKNIPLGSDANPFIIQSNINGSGQNLEFTITKGKAFNHPTFALWLEDTTGKYIQTIFVTQAIGKGIFNYGDKSAGRWQPGEVRRPAALPYWSHKRGVKAEDGLYIPSSRNPVPDAYTGATPTGTFVLKSRPDGEGLHNVHIMFEINQPWDWNLYWTNDRFPDDPNYMTSSQPAIVYEAIINLDSPGNEVKLDPVGYSHYSGSDGSLTKDLSTITTALEIIRSVKVKVSSK